MAKSSIFPLNRLHLLLSWIKERLWIKPLAMSLVSVCGIFIARLADDRGLSSSLPEIGIDSLISLLTIMASSMLVIATFAVGSMVAAYASASTGATPRSFSLVLADDVTQNALSAYVGAFIFSLVSLIAVKNAMFGSAGLFAMFILTVLVFAIVIGTFVIWVDRIARLGRVPNTIAKVEKATADALDRRRHSPTMGALPLPLASGRGESITVCASKVGYVQNIDLKALQSCAEEFDSFMIIDIVPGAFVGTRSPLLRVKGSPSIEAHILQSAFTIGRERAFEDDPRFGLLALSEIAAKALSPSVNDPGTAINIISVMVRLFTLWRRPLDEAHPPKVDYDRVAMPMLGIEDLFDDAFTAIGRDGAALVEVSIRLQKGFGMLAGMGDQAMQAATQRHSRMALARSEQAMTNQNDIDLTRMAAAFGEKRIQRAMR